MVSKTLQKQYNKLIYKLLVSERVEKIVCNREDGDNRFFDDLYVDKKKKVVIVHSQGLKYDFEGFGFDFSLDYAMCLAQIEKAIYLHKHNTMKENEGLVITFRRK